MTEYEKMQKGIIHDSLSEDIGKAQRKSRLICEEYNRLSAADDQGKQRLLKELFPSDDFGLYRIMEAPIFIDNCNEIKIGRNFYSNIHFSFIGAVPQISAIMCLSVRIAPLRQGFIRFWQTRGE